MISVKAGIFYYKNSKRTPVIIIWLLMSFRWWRWGQAVGLLGWNCYCTCLTVNRTIQKLNS